MLNPKILILTLFALFYLGAAEGAKTDGLNRIVEQKSVTFGTLFGASNFQIIQGRPSGIEFELAKKFADKLKVKLEIRPFTKKRALLNALNEGEIDIAAANILLTHNEYKNFKFGSEYHHVQPYLISKHNVHPIHSLSQISQSIAVSSNSGLSYLLEQEKMISPQLTWKEFENKSLYEIAQLVDDNRFDHALIHTGHMEQLKNRYPQLIYTQLEHQPIPISWFVSSEQNDTLRLMIIEFFGQISKSGQLTNIKNRYSQRPSVLPFYSTQPLIHAAKNALPNYEKWFKSYADAMDWRLIAALSYEISKWQADASLAYDRFGLMGLSLNNASQQKIDSRLSPEDNIRAGALRLNKLYQNLPNRIQPNEKISFAIAAYFVGISHIETARKLTLKHGGNPDIWLEVKQYFPKLETMSVYALSDEGYVPGADTVQFVENVKKYFDTLVWLDAHSS